MPHNLTKSSERTIWGDDANMMALLLIVLSGPCRVIAGGSYGILTSDPLGTESHIIDPINFSDWMTYDDAYAYAEGWALLGITAEVYCRPPRKDQRVWI
jgi:hypothetical protein